MKRLNVAVLSLALALQATWVHTARAGGRGSDWGAVAAGGIIGLAAGMILGKVLSGNDRREMDRAYDDAFDENMAPGGRTE